MACSTARDLQEWLHALAEFSPIDSHGLPGMHSSELCIPLNRDGIVPMLSDAPRTHMRHSTAPHRIEGIEDEYMDQRESEFKRRDSYDTKKMRPYIRKVQSKPEVVRMVRYENNVHLFRL